ncbi:MAG: non-histone chromosomal MC1 family protein [Candidatus Altiarchaeota archaeon]|nr:non-histone chromosomal MC1 family protein [Candidatus Altiarchaeota archaeon]
MAKSKKKKAGVKYYELKKGKTKHVFTGRTPRQAALKAATRGFSDIKLRERGRRNKDKTYSIHVFKGSTKMVSSPADRPSWLPAKVKKPTVKKIGVDRVKKI